MICNRCERHAHEKCLGRDAEAGCECGCWLKSESVLDEAARIITGARREAYGDTRESFDRIAGMWSAYLGKPVTGLDVVNLMCLLKVSRAANGFHRDSYVDICGYAALSEQLQESQQ